MLGLVYTFWVLFTGGLGLGLPVGLLFVVRGRTTTDATFPTPCLPHYLPGVSTPRHPTPPPPPTCPFLRHLPICYPHYRAAPGDHHSFLRRYSRYLYHLPPGVFHLPTPTCCGTCRAGVTVTDGRGMGGRDAVGTSLNNALAFHGLPFCYYDAGGGTWARAAFHRAWRRLYAAMWRYADLLPLPSPVVGHSGIPLCPWLVPPFIFKPCFYSGRFLLPLCPAMPSPMPLLLCSAIARTRTAYPTTTLCHSPTSPPRIYRRTPLHEHYRPRADFASPVPPATDATYLRTPFFC